MNSKDYKEIAKIINEVRIFNKKFGFITADLNRLSNKLADYFEREWKKICMEKYGNHNITTDKAYFNRKQFLKECGVAK